MKEIAHNLYVGNNEDFQTLEESEVALEGWLVVHACKEPYHRQFVGYSSRGAPPGDEYLWSRKQDRIALNFIDADDHRYIPDEMIVYAVKSIRAALEDKKKVLIHCNQGKSRGPTLAMLVLANQLHPHFEEAVNAFKKRYTEYEPAEGVYTYAARNWEAYYSWGRGKRKL